jgi:hypothetical protein
MSLNEVPTKSSSQLASNTNQFSSTMPSSLSERTEMMKQFDDVTEDATLKKVIPNQGETPARLKNGANAEKSHAQRRIKNDNLDNISSIPGFHMSTALSIIGILSQYDRLSSY